MKIKIKIIAIFLIMLTFSPFLSACRTSNFVSLYSKNVSEYKINASINCKKKEVEIEQIVKYVNRDKKDKLDKICFHIYPKAFSDGVMNKPVSTLNENKAYPNGKSYGEVNIDKVIVNNTEQEICFKGIDKDILVVNLNKALSPSKSIEIKFEYNLKLPNINHRYGYGDNTINLGNFYLIACVYENGDFNTSPYNYNGDPFYSDISNYEVLVNYNSNYILVSSGEIVSESIENEVKTTKIQAKAVRDFSLTLSDKFKALNEKVSGVNVSYYYYNDKKPEASFQACKDSLITFNKLFGEYPYKTLNICETNFVYGGMEYPNLVFISDSLETHEDYIHTIVHEIAHQWWYGVVGNDEFKYGFLDESLTEYSTYLFYDENPSYNMNTDEMIKNTTNSYLLFIDVYREVFTKVDTTMLRSLDEYKTEPEYIYMAYVKGVLMFDNLKNLVGKTKFLNTLKYYYKQNMGKIVTPEVLVSAFNKKCNQNLTSFFNSWFNGIVVIEPL